MAKIPVYQEQVSPQFRPPRQPRESVPVVDANVRAVAQTASLLTRLGPEYAAAQRYAQEQEDRHAMGDAGQTAALARNDWEQRLIERELNAPEDPSSVTDAEGKRVGFARATIDDFEAFKDVALGSVSNERARQYLDLHLTELGGRVAAHAMTFESDRQAKYNLQRVQNATDAYGQVLARDDSTYGVVRDALHTMIENTLTPGAQEAARDAVDKQLADAANNGMIERDPQRARALYRKALGMPEAPPPAAPRISAPIGSTEFAFPLEVNDATRGYIGGVNAAADKYGVDQNFLLAQIYAESRGNPKARSPVAPSTGEPSIGLAQFQPATAKRYGIDPTDPAQSIDGQARYMRDLLAQFGGDYRKAAAGYNWGEGNVIKAVAKYGDQWLEHAPAETQKYVGSILTNIAAPAPMVAPAAAAEPLPLAAPSALSSTGVPFVDNLPPARVVEFMHRADAEANKEAAGLRAGLESRLRDVAAMAHDGVRAPNPPSPQDLVAAWGPEQGARLAYDMQRNLALADSVGAFKGQPASVIAASVNALTPDPATEGYAQDRERHAIALQAANQVLKDREADPADFARRNSTQVKAAADAYYAALADPQADTVARRFAAERYASTTLAEQQRLEVQKPAILSQGDADNIVRMVTQYQGSGDKIAGVVAQLSDTWGPRWPQVYGELVSSLPGKHLPDSFIVIPSLHSAAAREEVARLDGVPIAELKKQADGAKPQATKDVTEKLGEALAPFAESLLPNQQNGRSYTAIFSAAEKMALARVVSGASVSDAVNQAAAIVTDGYDFPNTGSAKRYAVPKTEQSATVAEGVRVANSRIALWHLPAPLDESGAYTPAEAEAKWKERIVAQPLWVTNADESGLLLYATGADGRPRPVLTAAGSQVGFTWDDLRGFVQSSAGYPGSRYQPIVPTTLDMRVYERAQAARKAAAIAAERANPPGRIR